MYHPPKLSVCAVAIAALSGTGARADEPNLGPLAMHVFAPQVLEAQARANFAGSNNNRPGSKSLDLASALGFDNATAVPIWAWEFGRLSIKPIASDGAAFGMHGSALRLDLTSGYSLQSGMMFDDIGKTVALLDFGTEYRIGYFAIGLSLQASWSDSRPLQELDVSSSPHLRDGDATIWARGRIKLQPEAHRIDLSMVPSLTQSGRPTNSGSQSTEPPPK